MLVVDIETKPQPIEVLRAMFRPKTKDEFVGAQRWKPETIEAKYAEYLETAFTDFVEGAALDATTGEVVAIGYLESPNVEIELAESDVTEEELIARFWQQVKDCFWTGKNVVGHNLFGFDLPFLIRRSWILGVQIPSEALSNFGRRFCDSFICTQRVWCFDNHSYVSLDRLARALEVGHKLDGISGADFARLIAGDEMERAKAIDYLINDLWLTCSIAKRMGIK